MTGARPSKTAYARQCTKLQQTIAAQAAAHLRRGHLGGEGIPKTSVEFRYQFDRKSDTAALGTLARQTEPADKKAMFVAVAGAQYDVALGQPCIETPGLVPARRLVCDRRHLCGD